MPEFNTLRQLPADSTAWGTLGPTGIVQIIRAIEALRKEFMKVLESLIECLRCHNLK